MKSTSKMAMAVALVAVMALVTIVLAQKRAKAAQNEDGSSVRVIGTPGPEVGAAPDAIYGEALETPNRRRRRLAAAAATGAPPEQYPFAQAVEALKAAPGSSAGPTPQPAGKKSKPAREAGPQKVVSPSPTGNDAVAVSDHWQSTRDTPAEGKDGRVIYSEGAGMPTVVCAPLRLCVVELQAGERLTGDPQIGDSVRWNIQPANYGTGDMSTPMIVIKPKAVGLDTNLVITTDRRSYYLRLMSNSEDYVARVSFEYPDENQARWSAARQKQAQEDREAQFEKGIKTLADSVEGLNVDYRVKGDASIRPVRVLDDGVHTYIQMSPEVQHREAPVLAILGPGGKAEMVNYRVQGSVYVVDRLFDRGRLILGSGRKALKADIIRGSFKTRRLFARDPFRDLSKDEQTVEVKTQ